MKLNEALRILGFESPSILPKLKDIQKHFHRLSKLKHPDKNNGSKESTVEFQTLLDAYRIAGKAAEKVVPEKDDFEDIIAHKLFKQFQFSSVKVNSQSVTIKTEKVLNSIWLEILTNNLGEPMVNKDAHGKKFTLVDRCEEPSTNVYLTLYHTGNLLVQAQGNKQSINIHFLNSHLKDLFIQVYNRSKLSPKPLTNQSHKTPLRKLTKTSKNPLKKLKCPNCDYITNITAHLAKHMEKEHGNSVARRLSSFHEDEEVIADPQVGSPNLKNHCDLWGSGFVNKSEMNIHIKSAHELKCTQCNNIFYDKYDLVIHMNTHKLPEELVDEDIQLIKCSFCDSSFYTDSDMRLHMAAHHSRTNQNAQKDTLKTLLQELTEIGEIPLLQNHHELTHELSTSYNCDKCKFTTTEEVVYKHHTKILTHIQVIYH